MDNFNREELILISQALELRAAVVRCTIDNSPDVMAAAKTGKNIRKTRNLSEKVQTMIRTLDHADWTKP